MTSTDTTMLQYIWNSIFNEINLICFFSKNLFQKKIPKFPNIYKYLEPLPKISKSKIFLKFTQNFQDFLGIPWILEDFGMPKMVPSSTLHHHHHHHHHHPHYHNHHGDHYLRGCQQLHSINCIHCMYSRDCIDCIDCIRFAIGLIGLIGLICLIG